MHFAEGLRKAEEAGGLRKAAGAGGTAEIVEIDASATNCEGNAR